MKRILLFAAVLLVAASCSTLQRQRTTIAYFADYTEYPDMWISPNACTMAHQAIGQIDIEVLPAIGHTNKHANKKDADGIYANNFGSFTTERITYRELLGLIVEEARKKGANGISNLEIRTERMQDGTPSLYYISGLLIKVE